MGRFVQTDPAGIDGGLNLYRFVENDPIMGLDPFGMDMYDSLNDFSVSGYVRGVFWGKSQGILGNIGTAALATIGGNTVKALADRSGNASGSGNNLSAVGYGAATVTVISLDAVSFGRMGQMLAGTRAAGLEFSHSIPDRFGGPRIWANGSMVTPWTHAMSDPKRMLRGMELADKWPFWRQMLNRMPSWMQGLIGITDANIAEEMVSPCP